MNGPPTCHVYVHRDRSTDARDLLQKEKDAAEGRLLETRDALRSIEMAFRLLDSEKQALQRDFAAAEGAARRARMAAETQVLRGVDRCPSFVHVQRVSHDHILIYLPCACAWSALSGSFKGRPIILSFSTGVDYKPFS